jgi:hypothetical protein
MAEVCEACGAAVADDARFCSQCATPVTVEAAKDARIRELEREVEALSVAPAPQIAVPTQKTGQSLRVTGWVLFAVQCPLVLAYGLRVLPATYQGGFQGVVVAALLSPLLWVAVVLAGAADARDRIATVNDSTVAKMLFTYTLVVLISGAIAAA